MIIQHSNIAGRVNGNACVAERAFGILNSTISNIGQDDTVVAVLSVVDVDIAYDEIGVGVLNLYSICGRRVDLPTFDDVGGRSRSRTACHAVSRRETAVARNEYGRMRLVGRCGPKELNRPSEQ